MHRYNVILLYESKAYGIITEVGDALKHFDTHCLPGKILISAALRLGHFVFICTQNCE